MKYSRFEDLPVWQAAVEFALQIFEITSSAEAFFRGLGDTKNQLERAALSISNNIAEGFERGTNAELVNFLYIARGSAGESRSMLCLCERLPQFNKFKTETSNLKSRAGNISRPLFGWIEPLKNSDIRGEKFFTEKEKFKKKEREDWFEFRKELEAAQKRNIESASRKGEETKFDHE